MHIANCRVWVNPGHDVAKKNVTPAEVLVLRAMHRQNVGKDPVHELEVLGQIDRSNKVEAARLRGTYFAQDKKGVAIVTKLFPGLAGEGIPETFEGVWPEPKVENVAVELPDPSALHEEIRPIEAPVETA